MQTLEIQGFTYAERHATVPELTLSFGRCGGRVVGRKAPSTARMEFHLELQLEAVVEFYLAVMAAGVELTRAAHLALHDLCTCWRYSRSNTELVRVVGVRLEITFLGDRRRSKGALVA